MAKEKEVKKQDTVTVYGTGVSKHMPQGKVYKVHSVAAENLIEKGYAQLEKVDAASGEKKGKRKSGAE